MAAKVWNARRKWMGNVIPALVLVPLFAVGIYLMVKAGRLTAPGMGLCIGGLAGAYLAVNQFGFFDNANMRKEMIRTALAKAGKDASSGRFVGFARPTFVGVLDAHEDVGFFYIEAETLEFIGETLRASLPRGDAKVVRYRANMHTLLGLGRWVSVEGTHKGKPVRMMIEPREARTLLGNRKLGKLLKKELEEWLKKTNPGPEPGVA